eukprot:695217-Pleurochrysis_carterae.AAC.1
MRFSKPDIPVGRKGSRSRAWVHPVAVAAGGSRVSHRRSSQLRRAVGAAGEALSIRLRAEKACRAASRCRELLYQFTASPTRRGGLLCPCVFILVFWCAFHWFLVDFVLSAIGCPLRCAQLVPPCLRRRNGGVRAATRPSRPRCARARLAPRLGLGGRVPGAAAVQPATSCSGLRQELAPLTSRRERQTKKYKAKETEMRRLGEARDKERERWAGRREA